MVQDARIQYRRRHCYRTRSNIVKAVKTPGGRIVAHYHKKKASVPRCAEAGCNLALAGIKALRPHQYKKTSKGNKTVSRAYGGSLCGPCVRTRIVRAFLIEEQKIVKQVLAKKKSKKSSK